MTSETDGGAAGEDGKMDPDVPPNGIVKKLNNDKGGEKPSSVFGVVSHALNGVSVLGWRMPWPLPAHGTATASRNPSWWSTARGCLEVGFFVSHSTVDCTLCRIIGSYGNSYHDQASIKKY